MDTDEPNGVEVDGSGRTIDLASATAKELRQAWAYHCAVADRLRLEGARRADEEERAAVLREERQHRRVAVRVFQVIEARGDSL